MIFMILIKLQLSFIISYVISHVIIISHYYYQNMTVYRRASDALRWNVFIHGHRNLYFDVLFVDTQIVRQYIELKAENCRLYHHVVMK